MGKGPVAEKGCECRYHRYHVVHICGCGEVISHSQADWDAHRHHNPQMRTIPSSLYRHGDTAETLLTRHNDIRPGCPLP